MAARGLVNGRGPPRSGGRDSAKRVVFTSITLFSGVKQIYLTQGLLLLFRGRQTGCARRGSP